MYNNDDNTPRFDRVAMYLRKSRKDLELEAVGGEDTLERWPGITS